MLIRLISKLYTYRASLHLKMYRNKLYSKWIRNFMGSMGEGSCIFFPCKLFGGGNRNIHIGKNTTFHSNCILGCWERYGTFEGQQTFSPSIIIGNNCNIGGHTHITAISKITIGDGLLTGHYVLISDNAHGGLSMEEAGIRPARRKLTSKGEVVIGNNVWIGDKVTILGGVTIGDNVIIGANSVVTHNVPSNCVAAGVPAKIIKKI